MSKEQPTTVLEQKFWEHHGRHPEIFAEFDERAKELLGRGHRRYSALGLLYVIRFHAESDKVSFSNSHAPYYGRLWNKLNPEHKTFFKENALTSKKAA